MHGRMGLIHFPDYAQSSAWDLGSMEIRGQASESLSFPRSLCPRLHWGRAWGSCPAGSSARLAAARSSGRGGWSKPGRRSATIRGRPGGFHAATPCSGVRPVEPEHVTAGRQQGQRIALRQKVHQGDAAERRDGTAHDRRDAIVLEMAHEQIGGGGQIRGRARAFRQARPDAATCRPPGGLRRRDGPPRPGSEPRPRACGQRTVPRAADRGFGRRRRATRLRPCTL